MDLLKVGAITLGCAKNRVDLEEILGRLHREKFYITSELSDAEIIISNTCAFISEARQESIETIKNIAQYKTIGNCQLLIVVGCMPQKYSKLLWNKIPQIDLQLGVHSYAQIEHLISQYNENKTKMTVRNAPPSNYRCWGQRILTLPEHSVYLKIADGCDNRCNYCSIPSIRGPYRSRPLDKILDEANSLVKKGAREINLVAQDTTYYGCEKYGESQLPQLLKRLCKINGLDWIRLLYAHPAHLDQNTINILSHEKKVCSYIDLPMQHVNNKILKNMGRKYDQQRLKHLWKTLKQNNITIRSTFLLGFPGEGEAEFNELMSFLRQYPIDRVGAFTYSPEKDTPAYNFKHQIPSDIKKKRYSKFMNLQRDLSFALNQKQVGDKTHVLIEEELGKSPNETYYYRCRNEKLAPEVDGSIYLSTKSPLQPGNIVQARIFGCGIYDLLSIPTEQ